MSQQLPEKLKKLLLILSDGHYHSGEELGNALGITRAAVWKLLQQLSAWDIELEAKTHKGYCLPLGLELLDTNQLLAELQPSNRALLAKLEVFDSLPSTNDYLMQNAHEPFSKVQVCLSERQTAGKGRRGRQWLSPFGKNIYLSLGWRVERDPSQLASLSLAIGVALLQALKNYGINDELIGMKWPNDIYCQGKKLAGILLELCGETHSHCQLVIGIGINLTVPSSIAEQIDHAWVDIATLTQTKPQRNKLAGLVLDQILTCLSLFEQQGFAAFKAAWRQSDLSYGKRVKIITPTTTFEGIGHGIDEKGCFLLQNPQGDVQRFSSGEVSLRLK